MLMQERLCHQNQHGLNQNYYLVCYEDLIVEINFDWEPTAEQMKQMTKELERTGVALDTVLARYQISSVKEMTENMYNKAMNSLKKTKKKEAK